SGQETARTSLKTTGSPSALRAAADRPEIHTEFGDLAYVTVEVLDQEGCLVPWADSEISLEVTGAADLIAIGSANPMSEELYVGDKRKAWNGRLVAVLRSNGQAGEILFKANAEGLSPAEIQLNAK